MNNISPLLFLLAICIVFIRLIWGSCIPRGHYHVSVFAYYRHCGAHDAEAWPVRVASGHFGSAVTPASLRQVPTSVFFFIFVA